MSMAEIMQELPKLTARERSVLSERLRQLEHEDETLFLHEAAEAMFVAQPGDVWMVDLGMVGKVRPCLI